MIHAHNPFPWQRGERRRCRWCLRRVTPNYEWLHWWTPGEQRALDRRKQEHTESVARASWGYKL